MATFEEMLGMGDDTSDDDGPDELPGVDVPVQAPANKGRAQQALDFYMSKGLSLPAASGIVGNLMQESGSGLNPNLIHDGGIGVGIAGWNGTRRTALRNLAAARGTNEKDFDTQLEHSWRELNSTERGTMSMLRGAQTPEQAARIALGYFRPSDPQTQNRIRNAIAIAGGSNPSSPALRASYVAPTTDEENEQPAVLPPRKMITQDPARSAEIQAGNDAALPAIEEFDKQISPVPFLQQLLSKGASQTAAMPLNLLSATQLFPSIAGSKTAQDFIEANNRMASTNAQTADTITGAEADPSTLPGQVGKSIGESILPTGKFTAPMTAANAGMTWLGKLLASGDAIAAPAYDENGLPIKSKTKKEQKAEDEAAGIGKAQVDVYNGMPYDPNITGFDQKERSVMIAGRNQIKWHGQNDGITTVPGSDGKFYNVPGDGSPINNANIQNTHGWQNIPSYPTEAQAREAALRMNVSLQQEMDRRKVMINTTGGPDSVDVGQLMKFGGYMAAATAGAVFAPMAFKLFKAGSLPALWRNSVRDYSLTHPDVGVISTPGDVFNTSVHDINSSLKNIPVRGGLDPVTAEMINNKFNVETRGAAATLADSAVMEGDMRSLNYQFRVPVSMKQLNDADNQQVSQYMHARNIQNQFNELQTRNLLQPKSAPAPTTIRGLTEPDAFRIINDMEKANPSLKDFAKHYEENSRALFDFLATGEYATKTAAEMKILKQTRPSYIPYLDKQLDAPVPIGSATSDMGNYMGAQIRLRLENEAKGTWVDAVKDLPLKPGSNKRLLIKLTPEEARDNPKWSTFSFMRNGEKEVWATDPHIAAMMEMDPYYTVGSMGLLNWPAKIMMKTTTGTWAPWFAERSFWRNHQLAAQSAPDGMSAPWITQSMMGIPRQLLPQMAKSIGDSLDHGSLGWMKSVFGQQGVDGFAARLTQAYDRSAYARMEAAGTHYGSLLEDIKKGNAALNSVMKNPNQSLPKDAMDFMGSIVSHTSRMLSALQQSAHNAPAYAFVRKNFDKGMPDAQVVYEGRNLTGNPRASGQYFAKNNKPFAFSTEGMNVMDKGLYYGANAAGAVAELGRGTVPWFNATTQGMKRLGESYIDDPTKFVARMWLYNQMPAAATYMWSRGNGLDPNGRSYADYHVNGRSDWDHMMNHYIAIPGRPAEDGIRIPRFHEGSLAAVMMEHSLDHAYHSNLFPMNEDFKRAALNFMGIIAPSIPAVWNLSYGLHGQVPPQGWVGSGAYTPRENSPFDQYNNGLGFMSNLGIKPMSAEAFVRALAPGTGDIAIKSLAAAFDSPDAWNALKSFGKTVVKESARRTDAASQLLQLQPMSGNIPMMEQYYENKTEIDKLMRYFARNDLTTMDKKGNVTHEAGSMSLKPRSKSGAAVNSPFLPPNNITSNVGLDSPEPTNPKYTQFIDELYKNFKKDSVSTGGMGIGSAAKYLTDSTEYIRRLRDINEGNAHVWFEQQKDKPDYTNELLRYGVDPQDIKAVRTFFVQRQQNAAKHVLFMIKTVENKLGVKIKDLAPYIPEDASAPTDQPGY